MKKEAKDFTIKKCSYSGLILSYIEKLGFKDLFMDNTKKTYKENKNHHIRTLILIVSRLEGGVPLYLIEEWFNDHSISSCFPILNTELSDNNLGATLEYLAENGSRIFHALSVNLIKELDIQKANVSLDGSNISFSGNFYRSDLVTYGYNRDKRIDLKQVNFGVAIIDKIPIFAKVMAGNSNDHKLVDPFLDAINNIDYSSLVDNLVLDSLFSDEKTLDKIVNSNLCFIVGVNNKYSKLKEILSVLLNNYTLTNLDYKEGYKGVLIEEKLYNKYFQHLIFSEKLSKSRGETLQRQLEKVIENFDKLSKNAGKYCYKSSKKIIEKAEKYLNKYKEIREFITYEVNEDNNSLSFSYVIDKEKFSNMLKLLGYYIIATNNPELTTNDILREYKGRDKVEKTIQLCKKYYKVSPFFLEKDERIKGMLWIILLGALIISSIEYKVNENKSFLDKFCTKNQVSTAIYRAYKQYKVIHWLHISRDLENLQILYYDNKWIFMSNIRPFAKYVLNLFKVTPEEIHNILYEGVT